MELVKILGRAAPVTDVRLVPYFPIPRLDFGTPIPFHAMFGPLVDQLGPFFVILGRISPASEDRAVILARTPLVLVRLRFDGKVFRHKTNLRVGPHSTLQIAVKDAIQNPPIVNGLAVFVLAVSAGGTPLERGRAVAG